MSLLWSSRSCLFLVRLPKPSWTRRSDSWAVDCCTEADTGTVWATMLVSSLRMRFSDAVLKLSVDVVTSVTPLTSTISSFSFLTSRLFSTISNGTSRSKQSGIGMTSKSSSSFVFTALKQMNILDNMKYKLV